MQSRQWNTRLGSAPARSVSRRLKAPARNAVPLAGSTLRTATPTGRRCSVLRAERVGAPAVQPGEAGGGSSSDEEGMQLKRSLEQLPRVEDLAPEHWRTHLEKLKPGAQQVLRGYIAVVARINKLTPAMSALTDAELAATTADLRQRLLKFEGEQQDGAGAGSSSGSSSGSSRAGLSWLLGTRTQHDGSQRLLGGMPEDIVVEAFAVVREAAHRVLGLRHYDVQLLGGLVLHEGRVAEMGTGEGKTLVAALPAYLNALTGKGVHVVTVNEYLAKRDAEWIGKVFKFLGLSVGVLKWTDTITSKIHALSRDITYSTAYDLVFNYLTDNTISDPKQLVIRRPLNFALVDEVDSILIDEAINPLIITGPNPLIADQKLQAARWKAADEIIRTEYAEQCDQPGRVNFLYSDALSEEELLQEEGKADILVRPRYMHANITARGTTNLVRALVRRGLVTLATAADGRLAVAMVTEADGTAEARLAVYWADDSSTFVGGDGFAGVALKSRGAVVEELRKWELEPLAGEPSEQQLQAVSPLVLWGNTLGWGLFLTTCARAHFCYIAGVHYLKRDNQVVIIDLPTGREKVKSVWQAGVHQACEAKEGVTIRSEFVTTATISYQFFFKYYQKLAGMTGTAATEEMEFSTAYGLDVVRVPPHRPSQRIDLPLRMFAYEEGRNHYILQLLDESVGPWYARNNQPVLIGTGSVSESRAVARMVEEWAREADPFNINVNVLNADEERTRFEASTIAQAGIPRSVTIATNLAGRGTDILLGGNSKGLVQMLLENKLLPAMAPDSPDMDQHLPALPLGIASQTFMSDDSMAASIPAQAYHAFLEVRGLVKQLTQLQAGGSSQQPGAASSSQQLPLLPQPQQHGALPGPAEGQPTAQQPAAAQEQATHEQIWQGVSAPSPPAAGVEQPCLPWLSPGPHAGRHAGRDAVAWLSKRVEAAEGVKTKLKLHKCFDELDWAAVAAQRITEVQENERQQMLQQEHQVLPQAQQQSQHRQQQTEQHRQEDEGRQPGGTGHAMLTQQLELALERFILLQWLWFDTFCADQAKLVREAGGLRVIMASLPDTQRSELQLRGRSGRQGDPGDTHLAISLDDAMMNLRISAVVSGSRRAYEMVMVCTAERLRTDIAAWETYIQANPDRAGQGRESLNLLFNLLHGELDSQTSATVVRQAVRSVEGEARKSRDSMRQKDAVMDKYRRHGYRLRRIILQGGGAARRRLLHAYFLDVAHSMVTRLVDASQPPTEWDLDLLMQHLFALVNQADLGQKVDFKGAPFKVGVDPVYAVVVPYINIAVGSTAARLQWALATGGPLPHTRLQQPEEDRDQHQQWEAGVQKQLQPAWQQMPLDQAAAAKQQAVAEHEAGGDVAGCLQYQHSVRLSLREQQQLAGVRESAAAFEPPPPLPDSLGGTDPPLAGDYAPTARRLAAWVAEFLAVQHRNKRELLKFWFCDPRYTLGGATPVEAESMVSLVERDAMLARLDGLWKGLLEDINAVDRIVSARAYSAFEPLQEFELETSFVFARLLLDFKQLSVIDAFATVSIDQIMASSKVELSLQPTAESKSKAEAAVRTLADAFSTEEQDEALAAAELTNTSLDEMGAQDFSAMLDSRPDLVHRIEEGSHATAAARHAAALQAMASVAAAQRAATDLYTELQEAVASVTSAGTLLSDMGHKRHQDLLALAQELGPGSSLEVKQLLRRAEAAVADVLTALAEVLERPAIDVASAEFAFRDAADPIRATSLLPEPESLANVEVRAATLAVLQKLRDDAVNAAETAGGWSYRGQEKEQEAMQLLAKAREKAAGPSTAQQLTGVAPVGTHSDDNGGCSASGDNNRSTSHSHSELEEADARVRVASIAFAATATAMAQRRQLQVWQPQVVDTPAAVHRMPNNTAAAQALPECQLHVLQQKRQADEEHSLQAMLEAAQAAAERIEMHAGGSMPISGGADVSGSTVSGGTSANSGGDNIYDHQNTVNTSLTIDDALRELKERHRPPGPPQQQ